jgi:hypothetical protein
VRIWRRSPHDEARNAAWRAKTNVVPLLPHAAAVECRIQVVNEADGCTVHLAGRLAAAQVPELSYVCADAAGRLRIDLTDLLSADPVGIDALRRLRRRGLSSARSSSASRPAL